MAAKSSLDVEAAVSGGREESVTVSSLVTVSGNLPATDGSSDHPRTALHQCLLHIIKMNSSAALI